MTQATAEINENRAADKNKMGAMPVGRLIITMSLPVMLSMLVQALYNFIDSVYVSRIGENALTALSMAYPAQYLMIAVMTGIGVGVNALLSKSLGEKTGRGRARLQIRAYSWVLRAVSCLRYWEFCSPGITSHHRPNFRK